MVLTDEQKQALTTLHHLTPAQAARAVSTQVHGCTCKQVYQYRQSAHYKLLLADQQAKSTIHGQVIGAVNALNNTNKGLGEGINNSTQQLTRLVNQTMQQLSGDITNTSQQINQQINQTTRQLLETTQQLLPILSDLLASHQQRNSLQNDPDQSCKTPSSESSTSARAIEYPKIQTPQSLMNPQQRQLITAPTPSRTKPTGKKKRQSDNNTTGKLYWVSKSNVLMEMLGGMRIRICSPDESAYGEAQTVWPLGEGRGQVEGLIEFLPPRGGILFGMGDGFRFTACIRTDGVILLRGKEVFDYRAHLQVQDKIGFRWIPRAGIFRFARDGFCTVDVEVGRTIDPQYAMVALSGNNASFLGCFNNIDQHFELHQHSEGSVFVPLGVRNFESTFTPRNEHASETEEGSESTRISQKPTSKDLQNENVRKRKNPEEDIYGHAHLPNSSPPPLFSHLQTGSPQVRKSTSIQKISLPAPTSITAGKPLTESVGPPLEVYVIDSPSVASSRKIGSQNEYSRNDLLGPSSFKKSKRNDTRIFPPEIVALLDGKVDRVSLVVRAR